MDLELKGKRAIVTGGSRGIGLAIAKELVAEGATVAICGRGAEDVENALGELRAAGGEALGATADVTDGPALMAFVDEAAGELGGLDLLVACAGGLAGGANLDQVEPEDWEATLSMNVTHPALATRAAQPHMKSAGGGSVVFIASIAGMHPWTRSQYGAAKSAVIHLAGSLARELAPDGIRVNALSPGSIMFPGGPFDKLRAADTEAFAAWERAEFPFERLGTVEEIADVACFLLSARAAWVTGANVAVDGGQNPQPMISTAPIPGGWRQA